MPPHSPEMSNQPRRDYGGNPSSPNLSIASAASSYTAPHGARDPLGFPHPASISSHAVRNSPHLSHSGVVRNSPSFVHPAAASPHRQRDSPALSSLAGSPELRGMRGLANSSHITNLRNTPPVSGASRSPSSVSRSSPMPPQTLALANLHSSSPPSAQLHLRGAPDSPLNTGSSMRHRPGATEPGGSARNGPGIPAVARVTDSPQLRNDSSAQSSPSLRSANGQNPNTNGNKIKCVFIGDGAVGKTSLIISYTTNGYPNEYVPTAIDTYHAVVHVDGQPLTLELCDTPGQDDFDTLRPLVYPQTDVFLLCFSVALPSSFHNVREKWIPELRSCCGKVPVVLVGTQSDLREDAKTLVDLRQTKEQPVQENEARKLAQSLGCEMYVECSSLTQRNLKDVFDSAIVAGITSRNNREKKKNKKKKKLCNIL